MTNATTPGVMMVVVLVAVMALAFVRTAEADVLSEYLADKVFGPLPGPCPGPTINDEVCAGDVSDIRQSTQDSEDCIAEGEDDTCGSIGSYVTSGDFTIWDLQCSNLQIKEVQLSHVVMDEGRLLRAYVDVTNFKMSCTGQVRVEDLTMEIDDVIKAVCTFEGPFTMIQTPEFSGVSLRLQIDFATDAADSLDTELPKQIRIPYDECDIEPELNLQLSGIEGFESTEVCIFYGWGSWLSDDFGCTDSFTSFINYLGADNILNLVAATAEGYLGGVLCQILEDAAYIEDTGENGVLNEVWTEIKTQVDAWGLAKGQDVADAETDAAIWATRAYSGVELQELEDAIDFTEETYVESISNAVNDWLSPPSSRPEYDGRPVVNEVIDLYTEPAGTMAIDLVEYDAEVEVVLPLNVSDVTMRVQRASIQGLNTLSSFEILDIGADLPLADRLHRTFNNTLVADDLTIVMETYLRLDRGDWVTASCNLPPPGTCSSDSSEYTFKYSLRVQNVAFDISVLALVNPDELLDLQVGQLVGIDFAEEPFGAFSKTLRCVSPAIYALNLTNIEASIGEISDPQLIDFDGSSFSRLVQNSVAIGNDVAKGALRIKFPGIANGPIREYFNEVLLTEVSLPGRAGTQNCPPWEGPSGNGPTNIDFDGELFSPVYELVNEGVGGDPILNTDIDLNDLIDSALKYNEDSYPSFPFTSEGQDFGAWKLTDAYEQNGILRAFDFSTSGDYLQFYDATISNFDTLYKLTFASPGQGLDIDFGFGGALGLADESGLETLRPLEFSFRFQAVVPSRTIDEAVEVTFSLTELDFAIELTRLAIDFDLLYALYFSQIDRIPCLLAAVDRVEFTREARQAALAALTVSVTTLRTNPGNPSPLQTALANLGADQPDARAIALVVTAFDAAVDRVLDLVESIPGKYGDLTAVTCVNAEDSLDELTSGLLTLDLPNMTKIIDECTAEVGVIPSIEEAESEVYNGGELPDLLNVRESMIVKWLHQGFEMIKGETLETVFAVLVTSPDMGLSDYFVLDDPEDPDNTSVSFLFPLEKLGFGLDYTSEDPGFNFNAGTLRVKSVNRLLESFSFCEPVGSMTTRHRLSFRNDEPLEITIEAGIELEGSVVGETAGSLITDNLVLAFEVSALSVETDVITAVDFERFVDLALSQLIKVGADQSVTLADHAEGCLLSVLYEGGLSMRKLEISLGGLSAVQLTSNNEILSPGVEQTLSAIFELVAYFFSPALPRIAQNCWVTYMNDLFSERLEAASCPAAEDIAAPVLSSGDPLLRYDTLPLLQSFETLWFTDAVATGYTSVNTVLNDLLGENPEDEDALIFLNEKGATGDESFNVTVPLFYNGISYGELLFGLANVKLTGLGTFRDLRPLVPFSTAGNPLYHPEDYTSGAERRRLADLAADEQPYTTQTDILLEGPLTLEAKITINAYDVFEGYPSMVNEFDLVLAVTDVDVATQVLFGVDWAKLMEMRLRALTTLKQLDCLMVPVERLQLLDFNFSTSSVTVTGSCAGLCQFPIISYLEEGQEISNIDSAEASKAIDDFIVYVTGFLTTQGAQELIEAALEHAEEDCAALNSPSEEIEEDDSELDTDAASLFAWIFLGGCGLAGLGTLLLVPVHRRRQGTNIKSKLAGVKPHERGEQFATEMALEELRTKSIFQHPITPTVARYLVPFIQIMNVFGLVIAIGFSEAANIVMSITVFGAKSESVALVPFTLFSTINDTWNSGAWGLAIFIAVASCMWPIAKNLLLLFIWFAPTTIIGPSRRQLSLELLDMLGKWSFLDVFVIVITLAALRSYIIGAFYGNMSFLDGDLFVTDINVTPEAGLVLLAFVAALSLIINHVVVYFHERVVESNRRSEDHAKGNHDVARMMPRRAAAKLAIMKHEFSGTNSAGQVRAVNPVAAWALMGATGVAFLFICIGIGVPLITFELRGLLGLLLETISLNSETLDGAMLNRKTYSAVEMGAVLSDSPTTTPFEAVSIAFFKILYAVAVYAGPLVLLVMQVVLFAMPVNLNMGRSVFFWTKIGSYWSGLEIFLVALVLTVTEISVVTQFITDFITSDVCSQIRGSLELLVDSDLDAYCFNAVGYFEPTAFFLFTGVILELISFYIISVIAHAVLADRYFDAYKDFRSDAKPHKMLRVNRVILALCTRLQEPSSTSEGAVSPSSGAGSRPNSAGPFTDLEHQNDNALIEQDDPWCISMTSCCCCGCEENQRHANARIDIWQARFLPPEAAAATGANGSPSSRRDRGLPRRESDNPVFADSRRGNQRRAAPSAQRHAPAPVRKYFAPNGNPPPRARNNSVDV